MNAATRTAWRFAITATLVTRAVLLVVAWGAGWYLDGGDAPADATLGMWRRWDADIYADLAERGYDGAGVVGHSTAFWPLWPLLIRTVTWFGPDTVVAAMLLTTVATIVATAYLYRLAERDHGAGSGPRAALYLLAFPTAVFLVAGYAEALFLAGTIAAFFHARAGRWRAVALPAAVAVGARHVGVVVVAALAVEAWRRRDRAALPWLGVALTPLALWMAWLAATHGGPLRFLEDQRLGWGRTFGDPWSALTTTWTGFRDGSANLAAAAQTEIVAAFVGLAIVAWTVARREWGYATYTGLMLGLAVTSTWLFSVPRLLLVFFPAVLFASEATATRPDRHALLLAASTVLATFGVIVFTRGAWLS